MEAERSPADHQEWVRQSSYAALEASGQLTSQSSLSLAVFSELESHTQEIIPGGILLMPPSLSVKVKLPAK